MPRGTSHPTANCQLNTRSIGVEAKLPFRAENKPCTTAPAQPHCVQWRGGGEGRGAKVSCFNK